MKDVLKVELASRARTLKEIAAAYGVSRRTMKRRLDAIGIRKPDAGYYYMPAEVMKIVEMLGGAG